MLKYNIGVRCIVKCYIKVVKVSFVCYISIWHNTTDASTLIIFRDYSNLKNIFDIFINFYLNQD